MPRRDPIEPGTPLVRRPASAAQMKEATRSFSEGVRRQFRQRKDVLSGPYMNGAKVYKDGEGQ